MGWRKIKKEDVKRGVLVRHSSMNDFFNDAVIVRVEKIDRKGTSTDWSNIIIHLARPYAVANENFDCITPFLTCENYCVYLDSMCSEKTVYEVYESEHYSNRGEVRSMVT